MKKESLKKMSRMRLLDTVLPAMVNTTLLKDNITGKFKY